MFQFNLNQDIDITTVESDYFFAIFQINDYLRRKIPTILYDIAHCIDDIEYLQDQIINQSILFLKDNFLAFVLVHEFEIAKKSGVLESDSEEEKFQEFILMTSTAEWLEYFFEKYPLIEKRINTFINNSISYISFFVEKIATDYPLFNAEFGISGKITDIKLYLGDLHNGNKYVLRLDFSGNDSLYFKPRSFNNELYFEKIVAEFNRLGAEIPFTIPKSISANDYCWVSALEIKNDFLSEEAISEFYCNQGKLLFIFHLIGATDIIPDNLIISHNLAGYFDLECLITKPKLLSKESLKYMFDESVAKVGMLPDWMMNNNFEREILSSTFFELNSQLIKSKTWKKNEGSFEYINSMEYFGKDEDNHLPRLNGKITELNLRNLEKVIEGFIGLYSLTLKKKHTIVGFFRNNSDFENHKFRIILHPTSIYSLLYREINIPEYLRDSSNIDRIIENLVDITKTDNYVLDSAELKKSIKDQLFGLDVPYYWYDAGGKLYDGNKAVVSKEWKFDPSAYVIDRIENLSEYDLRFQTEIIRKTCEFAMEIKGMDLEKPNVIAQPKNKETPKNHDELKFKLLATAVKIGTYLNDTLFEKNGQINWISKVRDPADGRYNISLMNYDLYDGQTGISLFYLYLYKHTGNEIFKDNALKIFSQLNEATISRMKSGYYNDIPAELKANFPVSAYAYPLSYIYLASHFKAILGKEIVDNNTIIIILELLTDILHEIKSCDYLMGMSGLADCLLNLRLEFDEPEVNQRIGMLLMYALDKIQEEAIIENGVAGWPFHDPGAGESKMIGGFSHGTAGISYVLFKAGTQLENQALKELGLAALNFDRSFFDEELNGWSDKRDLGNPNDSSSWCHGSAGIGLGRTLTKSFFNDEYLFKEIAIARDNIMNNGFFGNQCICHGDFGNLEILKAMGESPETENFVYDYLNDLCDSFDKSGHFKCGDGGQMELLGLFMGYSGFGYQLLRFYNWQNTPSVLCLETPNSFHHELH